MPFRYDKLWNKLNNRNITRSQLRKRIGVSQTTITNMGKGENVSLDVIDKICDVLDCTPNDIMEYYNVNSICGDICRGDLFYIYADFDFKSDDIIPVVALQNNKSNKIINTVTVTNVIKLDSEILESNVPIVVLDKQKYSFDFDYAITFDSLRPVDKIRFISKITSLTNEDIQSLDSALFKVLELEF